MSKEVTLTTRLAIADLLSVTPRSVDRFVDEGMPIARRGKGRSPSGFRAKECVRWYVEREKAVLVGDESGLSPQRERALLDRKRREELELRLKVKRGDLVAIDEVALAFSECAAAVKARIRRIPDAVAERVIAAGTPQAAKSLLLMEIDEALRELADRGGQLGVEAPAAA